MNLMRAVVWSYCFLMAGCADLAAVKDISSRLTAASKNWDAVSVDIAGSCLREQVLNPEIPDCQLEEKASNGLIAADRALNEYFSALLAAASELNFTVKPGLDTLAGSVALIPEVDQAQVKAVAGLASLLARLTTERLREDTLRELILSGGPSAQSIVDGLGKLVVPRLRSRLDAERTQLSGYFARSILAQRDAIAGRMEAVCSGSNASKFSAVGFLLVQEYCKRVATVAKREDALEDYEASLAAASKALAELQASSTKLKATEVARKLYEIGRELDQNISAMQKAFG